MASRPQPQPAQQKQTISRQFLFNAGGIGLLVLGAAFAIQSHVAEKPQTPICEVRYSGGVLFSYARKTGEPLIAEDLQARLGGLDRALTTNSRIVADAGVPFGHALEVDLKAASAGDAEPQTRSGIGFTWMPHQLTRASAACLSYSVWVPSGFKSGEGGLLPGLVSEPPGTGTFQGHPPAPKSQADAGEPAPFSMRIQWRGEGALSAWQGAAVGFRGVHQLDPNKASLRPGRWVRIEQEAVLNLPGHTNGQLRVWVDGKLLLERLDVGFRRDEAQVFQGIVGDINYIRHGLWAPAPADTTLRLSPLELRLRE